MKAPVTRKRIKLHKPFFISYARKSVGNSIAIFALVKIRTSIDILITEMCKVSFGLKYNIGVIWHITVMQMSIGETLKTIFRTQQEDLNSYLNRTAIVLYK